MEGSKTVFKKLIKKNSQMPKQKLVATNTDKVPSRKKNKAPQKKQAKIIPLSAEEISYINTADVPLPGPQPAAVNLAPTVPDYANMILLIKQLILLLDHPYYTFNGFLSSFGMSRNTARKWMTEKGLPFIQVEAIICFRKIDVDEFLMRYRRVLPIVAASLISIFDDWEWAMAV